MNEKQIILVGGGGHCRSCIDVIEQEARFTIRGILDTKDKLNEEVLGYKVIGTDDDIEGLGKECGHFLITLGQIKSAELRVRLFNHINDLSFDCISAC